MKINALNSTYILNSFDLKDIQSHIEKIGAKLLKNSQFDSIEELRQLEKILYLDCNYCLTLKEIKNGQIGSKTTSGGICGNPSRSSDHSDDAREIAVLR